MPNRPLRSFFAIVAVVGSAMPGFIGANASAATVQAVAPSGGCWRYEPGPGTDIDDATGITDISTALEPWAPTDPRLTLTTAGDTVVGGVRTFDLDVAGGPTVSPSPIVVDGSATYLFDVLDPAAQRTKLAPIKVDFKIPALATSIPAMQATGSLPLALAGSSALILRGVYFDLPGLLGGAERLACNGQPTGDALVNPATTPLDTSVLSGITTAATTNLAVGRVVGQKVATAARPGDSVELALSGFGSAAPVALGFCGPGATPVCGPTANVTTLADGTAAASVVVPNDAVTGGGTVRATSRIGTADITRTQPMRVLGAPTLDQRNTGGTNRLRVIGAEWDPMQQVRVEAVDDDGERVGKSIRIEAGATGRIDARLTIPADATVTSVIGTQDHRDETLEANVDVEFGDAGSADGGTTGTDTSSGSSSGSTTSAAPVAAAPVLPLDIPAPVDLPVTTVSDPPAAGSAAADALAVTKVSLAGSTRFSDLFGRGPNRVLKLRIENTSAAEVVAPGLKIAVGKGKDQDGDPVYESDGFARLAPGASTTVEVPIGLPTGAFGVYAITGQVGTGGSGTFAIAWETYPWGLFGLNALGVLLIAFAIRRRVMAPAQSRMAALVGAPGAVETPGADVGAAVIDLAVLERWWALQAGGDDVREAVGADTMADAVVDVEAVERWLERCSTRSAEIG